MTTAFMDQVGRQVALYERFQPDDIEIDSDRKTISTFNMGYVYEAVGSYIDYFVQPRPLVTNPWARMEQLVQPPPNHHPATFHRPIWALR